MNIGIDVDGVLIDFEERFRYKAQLFNYIERNNNEIVNKDAYIVQERYGWNNEDWKIFSNKYLIELTRESKFMPGVKEVTDLLKKEQHKLFIISARGTEFEDMITIVEKKFQEENIKFDKYYLKLKNKNREKVIKYENIDIMIDDNPNTCKMLSNNGIKTLYFRNAYGNKLEENEYLKEVKNWGEIYRCIKENYL